MAPNSRASSQSQQRDHGQVVGQLPESQSFSSRVNSFHELSDFDYHYYNEGLVSPPASPTLRARESLVSLPAQSAGSTPNVGRSTPGRWPRPFATSGGGEYQPVTAAGYEPSSAGRDRLTNVRLAYSGMRDASAGVRNYAPADTIQEDRESIDIALLPAAAPIDGSDDLNHASPMHMRPSQGSSLPSSSAFRPNPAEIDEETRWRQEQELAGRLTGGLGAGFKAPAIRIREEDLPSPTSTKMQQFPSRALSFSRRKLSLSRSATRKALGQNEANRTGQAVQVIVEEPDTERQDDGGHKLHHSQMDLSFFAGDAMPMQAESEELRAMPSKRNTTSSTKNVQSVETFYPNPDWRPFSMRWPYLLTMIMLSFAFAGFTEALFQHSAKRGYLLEFNTPTDINGIEYFAIKFFPTLLAVSFGVLWQITDFDVKRLEAYYQLSKEHGATADDTLNVDYITSYSVLAPFEAFRRRHYAVSVSSIASLLAVSAIPPLCSASVHLSPDRETRMATPLGRKEISIDPVFSRLNEAVLIIVALLGCVLFYQLSTRRSGLLADVKGIAGLAAMANVSHILTDFKDCDVATHEDIHEKLRNHRYRLRNSALLPADDDIRNAGAGKDGMARIVGQFEAEHRRPAKYHLSLNPHPLMFRARGAVPFVVGISLFTVLLPVFLFTPLGDVTDKAPWVLTALAVCIKLAWGALDTTTRLMEPFYVLYKRHAPPRTLTLDYAATPFAWVAVRALLNGHWLVFSVGAGTVMTEFLTVLVSSLATVEGRAFGPARGDGGGDEIAAGEETVHSFWISLGSATLILLYMGVVATVVLVRRRKPFLPRQPNTIASVLAYVHQSKMLYEFVGKEKYSDAAMLSHLTDVGRTYGLGWFEGRDGRTHCGIDEEELSATYRHGVDYSRSNMPWVHDFTEWL